MHYALLVAFDPQRPNRAAVTFLSADPATRLGDTDLLRLTLLSHGALPVSRRRFRAPRLPAALEHVPHRALAQQQQPARTNSDSIAAALSEGNFARCASASIPRSLLWTVLCPTPLGKKGGGCRAARASDAAAPSRIQEHMHRSHGTVSFNLGTFLDAEKDGITTGFRSWPPPPLETP